MGLGEGGESEERSRQQRGSAIEGAMKEQAGQAEGSLLSGSGHCVTFELLE